SGFCRRGRAGGSTSSITGPGRSTSPPHCQASPPRSSSPPPQSCSGRVDSALVRPLALVGNLSRDVVDGGPPRIGGGPYYAAQAWRTYGTRGTIFTRCGPEDRVPYTRHLTGLGQPVVSLEGTKTTSFSFYYEGDTRIMTVEQPGDSWTPADAELVPPGAWVHAAPLLRSDFPAETLAAIAKQRTLSFDGQGLVRIAE